MIGLPARWYRYWNKRKITFSILLISLTLLFGYSAGNITIYEDITKTLPKSETFENFGKLIDHQGINRSIFFSIKAKSDEDLAILGTEFSDALSNSTGEDLKGIRFQLNEEDYGIYDYIDSNIPYYFEKRDYAELKTKLGSDSIRKKIKNNHQTLFSPEGLFLKKYIMNDPLSVTGIGLKKLESSELQSNFEIVDDLFMMPDGESLLVMASLNYSSNNQEKNQVLVDKIEQIKADFSDQMEVEYFAGFLIAQANANQIKADTQLTLTISIVAILALLFFYYRNLFLPIFFIVPAILGLLFALVMTYFIQGSISAISIGAGAIVLGIVMDYSFHFFTHLRHSSSVEETLEDISLPLLTGCLTTTLAFLALLFTNSPVLQDFGLFSALSLVGALLSVLFVLPVILPKFIQKSWSKKKTFEFSFNIGTKLKWVIGILIVGFSVVAIYHAGDIEFDDDLMNLNYYPDELKEIETKFNNIDPTNEKRVFLLAQNESKEAASQLNYEIFEDYTRLKGNGNIAGFLNVGFFDLPKGVKNQKIQSWNEFWEEYHDSIAPVLDDLENELGYYESTFDDFKEKTNGNYRINATDARIPLVSADIEKLIDSTDGKWTFISYFDVHKDDKDSIIAQIKEAHPDIAIVDRGAIAGALIQTVQSDFNFILLVSSGLVFICLLLVYGRVELALITFLPMILSWVWILGITAMLGLKFNFVNIILSTFIFGLGDDFAIFITDGFLNKFSRNKDVIKPYRQGILLSATTTIIGTGVLIFAVHPALNSIALISIIGMVAILIISFTVQPFLLRKLILERKERGLPPITLFNIGASLFSFGFFIGGCLALWPLQFVFRLIPFGQKKLKLLFHHLIRIFTWMLMKVMFNVRKRNYNTSDFDFSKPSVIIANHQSFIDIINLLSFHPKLVILTNDWVYNSVLFGSQIRYVNFLQGSAGVEENIAKLKPLIADGYSVIIFPEGTRSKDKKIGRFHKGAFYIAQELKLDITPVLLHGFNDTMRKNDFILLNGTLSTVVLPRISPDDPQFGEGYKQRGKNIAAYFKEEFKRFDLEHAGSKYLQPKIISNYIYRSPIIEWYVKVKWLFERKNFDLYNTIIPQSGNVFDLGCGYGYLSYYLMFRSDDRKVIGVDYDADKIEIANNSYSKNDQIDFIAADLRDLHPENASAIFLNDVLHYLPAEDHKSVLKNCLKGLNEGGVLIVRDGVKDLENRHKKTELTEKFSTKILKFNKTENQLSFFSKELIFNFAKENDLNCEIVEQSKSTSNILFILKK
ncbi:trifunctional MMPL family transporter/lysophospholipid acyltransferase/class I SAM-dependent methyltransferase [Crocinitomix catalasitica]|uniref:trifunctional MMPL family transporter/lysophospholipid acyltransferase/class I SAM-dependent methyltransferase n=1 Tax=Crocinitomix catalasitica TaxID=184607 RepID=UPI000485F6F2|nr:trifunctional MMPL family transporter/lysophospholipid acyltransferase/class I SAM-dependent methyltransferase [Crocinitomix catalasitica]